MNNVLPSNKYAEIYDMLYYFHKTWVCSIISSSSYKKKLRDVIIIFINFCKVNFVIDLYLKIHEQR